MAKKLYTRKAASYNSNYRKDGTRGKARHRTNFNSLLKRMQREHRESVRESLSALCHAAI